MEILIVPIVKNSCQIKKFSKLILDKFYIRIKSKGNKSTGCFVLSMKFTEKNCMTIYI